MVAALVWLTGLGIEIWRFGGSDRATNADCIIVLGAAIRGDQPSPVFAERIRHGVALHQRGLAPVILFTGGVGDGESRSESRVAANFAKSLGLPDRAILLEEKSRTTRQNLTEARLVMERHGLRSAILVSDPLHLKRATWMAGNLGIAAAPSPTPTTRYRSLTSRFGFLIREIYFWHHYLVSGN